MTTVPKPRPHLSAPGPDKALITPSRTTQGAHQASPSAPITRTKTQDHIANMKDLADSILLLQATTSRALPKLLPPLKADLRSAGVWLGSSRDLNPRATDLHLEIHRHVVQSLYIALIRSGLHLSRSAHTALAALCSWDPPFNGRSLHLLLEIRSVPAVPHLPGPACPISA